MFLRNPAKPRGKEHTTPRARFHVTEDRNKPRIALVKGIEAPSWTDLVMQVAQSMQNDPQTAAFQIVPPVEALSSEPFHTNVYNLPGLGRWKRCEEMALFLGTARQLG